VQTAVGSAHPLLESTLLTSRADVLDRNGRLAALKEVEPDAFHAVIPVA
jgi:hypothetical protein